MLFLDQEHRPLDTQLAHKLEEFYHENLFSSNIDNSTYLAELDGTVQFYHSGAVDIYLFAFDKNNHLIKSVYHKDVLDIDYNPLDERIAVDSVRNGLRIEGLTFAGLGLAIIMFLLEIGIKQEN